jgi:hypothetical protein
MKRYRYVILSSFGSSWDVSREIPRPVGGFMQMPWYGDEQRQDLLELLGRGWQPVRETGMGGATATGGAAVAFSLILLEKDRPEESPAVAEAIAADAPPP